MKINYFLGLLLILPACKKFLQVPAPPDQATTATVFSNDANATAAILSIYDNMNDINFQGTFMYGGRDLTFTCGRSADELINYDATPDMVQLSNNDLHSGNAAILTIWSGGYQAIYSANSVLDGLSKPNGVSPGLKTELEGEAKFVRAFCHFYLTNLFGDVPLILGTGYQANTLVKRTSQRDVYQQIITDLQDAKAGLSVGYTDARNAPSPERVRPVQAAAAALLARAYLYTYDYRDAESEAGFVISQADQYALTSLDSVFLKNSRETLWSLQPSGGTAEGAADVFILTSPPDWASLSPALVNAFETGDQRRRKWVGEFVDSGSAGYPHYFYPFKYKGLDVTVSSSGEYSVVQRLAEVYLIRAEARAQLGDIPGAQNDLNVLRSRAGLPGTTAATMETLAAAILHERQVELFMELGHRWLDLKRTGMADAVLGPLKPLWNTHAQLYPVPASDILTDPNLLPQNPGYN